MSSMADTPVRGRHVVSMTATPGVGTCWPPGILPSGRLRIGFRAMQTSLRTAGNEKTSRFRCERMVTPHDRDRDRDHCASHPEICCVSDILARIAAA